MTYNQVVAHYRGLSKAAKALGLSRQTVHSWRRLKRIPSGRQIRIEAKTGLKADKAARREAAELVAFLNGR
jgi:hypothetical protein